jgi:ribonuclease P protein component
LKVAALFPGRGLVGIATAKKIGVKPRRNRVKRRVREAIRLAERNLGLDYVVIASPGVADAPFGRIGEEVRRLLNEAEARWAEELASS